MANIIDRVSTTRDALWASSISCQAISRKISFPHIQLTYQAAGPATKMLFYEVVNSIMHAVPSGQSAYPHPAYAVERDRITPLEMTLSVETSHAAAGMKRTDANQIVKEILKKYETNVKNAPKGKKYQECYNLKTGRPTEEHLAIYEETKKEVLRSHFKH